MIPVDYALFVSCIEPMNLSDESDNAVVPQVIPRADPSTLFKSNRVLMNVTSRWAT